MLALCEKRNLSEEAYELESDTDPAKRHMETDEILEGAQLAGKWPALPSIDEIGPETLRCKWLQLVILCLDLDSVRGKNVHIQ